MENLSVLVKSLSQGEEKLVRHFYKLRDFGEYRKRVQLFDFIANGKVKDDNGAAKVMGYPVTSTSYHNLKSRLKSDIVCILLMQESSSKFNTPYAQAVFSCRRALLTGELLLNRGVYQEGLNLLKKAARVAEKFELYAERIIAEDTLRNHYAVASDSLEMHSGTDAIETNYRLLGNMMKSKRTLYQAIFSDSESKDGTLNVLDELDRLETESESSRVSFYSGLSRLKVLNNAGESDKALACALELLASAEKDPIVMSASNQAGIHLEIAGMYLRSLDFPNTIKHAMTATGLFKCGMLNHLRASTVLFYAQVHSGFFDKAQATLNQIHSARLLKEKPNDVLNTRILLISAWFYLAINETDQAAALLKQCAPLLKEKSVWSYGFGLLESMLLMDKGAHDVALYKLDALKKMMSRIDRDASTNRILSGIALLKQVLKAGGDYNVVRKKPLELDRLRSNSPDFGWDPTGFELVRIEEMILNRASRKRG